MNRENASNQLRKFLSVLDLNPAKKYPVRTGVFAKPFVYIERKRVANASPFMYASYVFQLNGIRLLNGRLLLPGKPLNNTPQKTLDFIHSSEEQTT